MLALAKIGNEHNLPVRKLERIVMRGRSIEIDPSKARNLMAGFPGRKEPERRIAFDFIFERQLRPRQQTDCHARLGWIRKAARYRIWKVGRYQLVADRCGPGCNIMKTVVTHRTPPICPQRRR